MMLVALFSVTAFASTTFDFNAMDVATSSSESTAGDITKALEMTQDDVTLIISPKEESATTPNRFWGTRNGAQLRMYSGTLTFTVPEGKQITGIVFNYAKWNEGNGANSGEITDDADAKAATWKGEAQTVVVTIAANTQINSIEVTMPGGIKEYPFSFEDGTMEGWTTIDADGDGYTWKIGAAPQINTCNEGQYSVYSESYSSSAGALTPDNFLVSPQMKLDGKITFYACAQDGKYPTEHFAVCVSTNGNVDAADFQVVEEWNMTAARADDLPANAPRKFRANRRTPGAWYQYTVDLSSYAGADGYVAIRHFDCTDMFYLVVDDITLASSHIYLPDYTISPAEGVVKKIDNFTLTFNNYDIDASSATATLTNTTTSTTQNGAITAEGNTLTIAFEPTTEAGDYTLAFACKQTSGEDIALNFNYTIEAKPDVVVLPEGVEPQTWYFTATASQSNIRNQEIAVAFDGSDIYVQGLCSYLPEAWVKGTLEGNTATFPTGQYFGTFENGGTDYDMFFVGYDGNNICDVEFAYDAEAGTFATEQYIIISALQDAVSYYEYYQNATISNAIPETPDLVVLPEGATTEVWTIDGTLNDNQSSDNIVRQTEVAFVGSDIYVKGIPFYFEESWMKGTINAETGIATFPSGQFVGEDDYGLEYMIGSDDGQTICDIQFAYDTEAKTLTQVTTFIIENGNTADEISPYDWWTDMLIYAGEAIIVDPVEAPEGLETESYAFNATVALDESGTELEEPEAYSYQMQVGFDGDDVYFKGLSDNTADMWLKATKNEDGKYVIPANQYMGQLYVWGYTFDYYFTAVDEANNMVDIVLNYDAETNTFTTDQTLVLHDGKRNLGEPYQVFTDVVITKMAEFAATPANPSITSFTPTGSYPKANFDIPLKDVEGNDLLADKMFYTVWVEKEGDVVEPFEVVAGVYENVTENMTEIPYSFDDNWDIYKGGNPFYFNPTNSVESFKKIGVQSIYRGGGGYNKSEIVWVENGSYTGISSILTDAKAGKAVIYNLNGQRVENAQKGLYIINGKKVVVK